MSDVSSVASGEDEQDETKANDLSIAEIVTKYRLAGDIATKALAKVISLVAPGKTPLELCKAGDAVIVEACAQVYVKQKSLEKGVAFPTCASVNNCVGHFSPLEGEDGVPLQPGDVLKIDLGVQIDACAPRAPRRAGARPARRGAPRPARSAGTGDAGLGACLAVRLASLSPRRAQTWPPFL